MFGSFCVKFKDVIYSSSVSSFEESIIGLLLLLVLSALNVVLDVFIAIDKYDFNKLEIDNESSIVSIIFKSIFVLKDITS